MFLSGLASGIVYGGFARQHGLTLACRRILRRSVEIYIAQMLTLVLLLVEVFYLAVRQPGMLDQANLGILVAHPAETIVQAMLMRYSPVNLDPLSLMVTLHFGLLVILPATMRWPTRALAASAALYLLTHLLGWSIPAYPRGELYFNPLNWQFLFVIGVWWGMGKHARQLAFLRSKALAGIAIVYLLASLLISLSWQLHSLEAYVPAFVSRIIYPIDKGNLDVLRLSHFLALALLCWRLLPRNFPVLKVRGLLPLMQCGEYSLAIYCVGVLLSFAAHAFLTITSNSLASQTLISIGGISTLTATAAFLAAISRTAETHPRTL